MNKYDYNQLVSSLAAEGASPQEIARKVQEALEKDAEVAKAKSDADAWVRQAISRVSDYIDDAMAGKAPENVYVDDLANFIMALFHLEHPDIPVEELKWFADEFADFIGIGFKLLSVQNPSDLPKVYIEAMTNQPCNDLRRDPKEQEKKKSAGKTKKAENFMDALDEWISKL